MENLIVDTLKDIELEAYYLTRPSELMECIVFNYIFKPCCNADNEIKAYEYTVLLNLYVKSDYDISDLRDRVIKAMSIAKFKIQQVPSPQVGKDFIEIALPFKIKKFI
ncbi:MAG: hypothetical protein ACRC7N_20670 [Clostridium sp.]